MEQACGICLRAVNARVLLDTNWDCAYLLRGPSFIEGKLVRESWCADASELRTTLICGLAGKDHEQTRLVYPQVVCWPVLVDKECMSVMDGRPAPFEDLWVRAKPPSLLLRRQS